MLVIIMGALAFVCFFVYDLNSVIWKNRMLHQSFTTGIIFVVLSTSLALFKGTSSIQWNQVSTFLGVFSALISLTALIYTLFFALPFKETYGTMKETNDLCTDGVYALCRHPGFWPFAGFYLSLCIIVPTQTIFVLTFILVGLNFLYILFQDQWTFRKTFVDYDRYTDSTPFLMPTFSSINQCIHT
ncbi:MAG: hypothetical protein EOM23_08500, partial [Candidatus Moranbacteria bacterium]|nr:hypothetical protein [Candidatus Moranbacteria bacterium]